MKLFNARSYIIESLNHPLLEGGVSLSTQGTRAYIVVCFVNGLEEFIWGCGGSDRRGGKGVTGLVVRSKFQEVDFMNNFVPTDRGNRKVKGVGIGSQKALGFRSSSDLKQAIAGPHVEVHIGSLGVGVSQSDQ